MANKLIAWIRIQELYKHPTTLFPFLLGTAIAWSEGGAIDWRVFAVAIIATYFVTNGTFIINEYYDYETDRINIERLGRDRVGVTTTGGTRVLVEGLLPSRHVLIASIIFFIALIPLVILLQFYFNTGILTIPVSVFAILLGLFYTAPPIKASYRGFGELFMAVGFTIPIFMGYYLQRGFNWLPLIVALPWTVAIPALKIIREFPDYEADLSANKRNLVVLFSKEKMAPVYILLIICSLGLFIPIIFITPELSVLLLLLPAFFLIKSLIPMIRGEYKNKEGLEAICKHGFLGMLFIPMALTGIFVINGLLSAF